MKDLRDIRNDYKPTILQGLYDETFTGVDIKDIGGAWQTLRYFYDADIFFQFVHSDHFLFEDFTLETIQPVNEKLFEVIADFYKSNPKLFNEKFTLNNNFYNVNLRLLIVDSENALREYQKEKAEESAERDGE